MGENSNHGNDPVRLGNHDDAADGDRAGRERGLRMTRSPDHDDDDDDDNDKPGQVSSANNGQESAAYQTNAGLFLAMYASVRFLLSFVFMFFISSMRRDFYKYVMLCYVLDCIPSATLFSFKLHESH